MLLWTERCCSLVSQAIMNVADKKFSEVQNERDSHLAQHPGYSAWL